MSHPRHSRASLCAVIRIGTGTSPWVAVGHLASKTNGAALRSANPSRRTRAYLPVEPDYAYIEARHAPDSPAIRGQVKVHLRRGSGAV